MSNRQRSKRLAAVIAGGALTLGLMVPAFAQDDTSTDESATDDGVATFEDRRAARDAELAAGLAEELGLDETTVSEALTTVREELRAQRQAERRAALEERLVEAVEAGELTQEQADAFLDAHDAGVLGSWGGRQHHGPGGRGWKATTAGDTGAAA